MIKRLWFWSKNAYELGYLNWYVQFWQKLCITKILSYRAIQGLSILKIKHLTLTRSWMNGPWTFPRKEKKTRCIFFYRNFRDLEKKQKHGFWIKMNEWMTNLSAERKKYGTFAGDFRWNDIFMNAGDFGNKITLFRKPLNLKSSEW